MSYSHTIKDASNKIAPYESYIEDAVAKMDWMDDILAMVRWRNNLEKQLLQNDIVE